MLLLPHVAMLHAGFVALAAPRRSLSCTSRSDRVTCCKRDDTRQNSEVLPQSFFSDLDYSSGTVPWDLIGRPQPPVRNAAKDGCFGVGTAVLDCGCGAGDNANWLASRGFHVLGFDLSTNAIATARRRSAEEENSKAIVEAGGSIEFVVASAVDLTAAQRVQERARELGGFKVALDSALLHCLDDAAQRAYLNGLQLLMRPGGRLFVGCFSDRNPDPWENPRRLSEGMLRELFKEEQGWQGERVAHANHSAHHSAHTERAHHSARAALSPHDH